MAKRIEIDDKPDHEIAQLALASKHRRYDNIRSMENKLSRELGDFAHSIGSPINKLVEEGKADALKKARDDLRAAIIAPRDHMTRHRVHTYYSNIKDKMAACVEALKEIEPNEDFGKGEMLGITKKYLAFVDVFHDSFNSLTTSKTL
jgi:hypothetical protein